MIFLLSFVNCLELAFDLNYVCISRRAIEARRVELVKHLFFGIFLKRFGQMPLKS